MGEESKVSLESVCPACLSTAADPDASGSTEVDWMPRASTRLAARRFSSLTRRPHTSCFPQSGRAGLRSPVKHSRRRVSWCSVFASHRLDLYRSRRQDQTGQSPDQRVLRLRFRGASPSLPFTHPQRLPKKPPWLTTSSAVPTLPRRGAEAETADSRRSCLVPCVLLVQRDSDGSQTIPVNAIAPDNPSNTTAEAVCSGAFPGRWLVLSKSVRAAASVSLYNRSAS